MKKLRSIILLAFMAVGLASSAQNQFVDIANAGTVDVYVYFTDGVNPPTTPVLVPAGTSYIGYDWGYTPAAAPPVPKAMVTVAGCSGPYQAPWYGGLVIVPGCPTGVKASYSGSGFPNRNDKVQIIP